MTFLLVLITTTGRRLKYAVGFLPFIIYPIRLIVVEAFLWKTDDHFTPRHCAYWAIFLYPCKQFKGIRLDVYDTINSILHPNPRVRAARTALPALQFTALHERPCADKYRYRILRRSFGMYVHYRSYDKSRYWCVRLYVFNANFEDTLLTQPNLN